MFPYFHINPLQPRVLFIFILLVPCIDFVYEDSMAYYIHKAGNVWTTRSYSWPSWYFVFSMIHWKCIFVLSDFIMLNRVLCLVFYSWFCSTSSTRRNVICVFCLSKQNGKIPAGLKLIGRYLSHGNPVSIRINKSRWLPYSISIDVIVRFRFFGFLAHSRLLNNL